MDVDRAIHLTLSRVEGRMDTSTFTDRYQLAKALEKLFSYDEYKQALSAALLSAKLDSEALNGGPDTMETAHPPFEEEDDEKYGYQGDC